MSQLEPVSQAHYLPGISRLLPFFYRAPHIRSYGQAASIANLLDAVREASTARQLIRRFNVVQARLWSLGQTPERLQYTQQLVEALREQVLSAPSAKVSITAAGLLRMLLQLGGVSQPEKIFETLVRAVLQIEKNEQHSEQNAQAESALSQYLQLLFGCFWPFHYPYPAYTWQQFPPNDIFYPLVPLLDALSSRNQEMLQCIFSELPHFSIPPSKGL